MGNAFRFLTSLSESSEGKLIRRKCRKISRSHLIGQNSQRHKLCKVTQLGKSKPIHAYEMIDSELSVMTLEWDLEINVNVCVSSLNLKAFLNRIQKRR